MKRRILSIALGALGVLAGAFLVTLHVAPYSVPDFESVRGDWRGSDAWLLDRNGETLSRVRVDHERRRGDWVAVNEVSPALTAAVLASEDRRFREHRGVAWLGMLGALQQTAAGGRRDLIDKWRQMRQAVALERAWSKDRILETWLNLTPFRGELEGVDAAVRALFGKRAGGLDRVESALLAALARAPN